MEALKSSVRPFKSQDASVRSLSGDCDYYRVRLNSAHKSHGNNVEAIYNINQLFPNSRANLMDGEWYAYLEEFVLRGFSQWGRPGLPTGEDKTSNGLRVCLPDLLKPSKDFVVTPNGLHPDHTLAFVPKSVEPSTQPLKVFEATVAVDIHFVVTVTFVNPIGTLLNDGNQISVFGLHLGAGDIGTTQAQADAINAYINRFDITINNVEATGATFTFDPAGPAQAGQAGNAVGDLVGAYPAHHPHLNNQNVKVLIEVWNGTTVNTDPTQPASIYANDNPWEPVYKLQQQNPSVGHAINPGQLFSGQLTVVLKGEDHKPITNAYSDNTISLSNIYGYEVDYDATIVFVHKKKSNHY